MDLPAPESLTPNEFSRFLSYLRRLLRDLPPALPVRDSTVSKYSSFVSFEIDEELLDRTGTEIGALNEQFKAVFGWKSRTTGDQILSIEERGAPVLAIVDILERFHLKYPKDNVLKKWGIDIAAGAHKIYNQYGMTCAVYSLSAVQTTESEMEMISSFISVSSSVSSTVNPTHKPNTNRGRPLNVLMNRLITRFEDKNGEKAWRCVGPTCEHVRKGNPQEARVLKHASSCPSLPSDLKQEAATASRNSSLGAQLQQCPPNQDSEILLQEASDSLSSASEPVHAQAVKKLKSQSKLDLMPFRQATKRKHETERQDMQKKVDHAILRLICVRGLVPTILDQPEWKELVNSLNPDYRATSSSMFTDDYIPKEAAFVRGEKLAKLKAEENLTLTFDGTNTRKPHSIYTVHATTPTRETFFLDGYEDSAARHDTKWVKDKIFTTIQEVGAHKWAGICSDSTAVTKNARCDVVASIPTILNLNDVCHHIQNTIKNITALLEFEQMISFLRPIIKHFSKSAKAVAHLRKERRVGEDDEKVNMLQRIGKTRFGTHWLATTSLEQCFPNVRNLVCSKTIKFKSRKVQEMFHNRGQYQTMEREMATYTTVVAPFIRSLWALEAAHANASDVYVFWLAIAATLKELFAKGECSTGIPPSVAYKITAIYNTRWKEFFTNDVYFTAFALDPRYPLADFLIKAPLAPPTIIIPARNPTSKSAMTSTTPGRSIPHLRAFERAKNFLKRMLRNMVEYSERTINAQDALSLLVQQIGPAAVVEEFRNQLESYWCNEWPFNVPIVDGHPYAWWEMLKSHPHGRVLAILATKIFAILVNSMPDERTGSTFTWFNSPLRANQNPQTLINMIQIGQWYRSSGQRGTKAREPTVPYRPVVKFRDVDADLLRSISVVEGDSQDTAHDDESNSTDSESGLEDDRDNTADFTFGSSDWLTDDEVSLDSPLLLDLLSVDSVRAPQRTAMASRQDTPVSRMQPNWDF